MIETRCPTCAGAGTAARCRPCGYLAVPTEAGWICGRCHGTNLTPPAPCYGCGGRRPDRQPAQKIPPPPG